MVPAGPVAPSHEQYAGSLNPGYCIQPWEEESFVCDELVKRLWSGDSDHLPEPGFCTTALRYAVRARGNGTSGAASHAN